MTYIVLHT